MWVLHRAPPRTPACPHWHPPPCTGIQPQLPPTLHTPPAHTPLPYLSGTPELGIHPPGHLPVHADGPVQVAPNVQDACMQVGRRPGSARSYSRVRTWQARRLSYAPQPHATLTLHPTASPPPSLPPQPTPAHRAARAQHCKQKEELQGLHGGSAVGCALRAQQDLNSTNTPRLGGWLVTRRQAEGVG